MIALYLVGVNPEKRALAIRAVKAALVAAGMPNDATTFEAADQAVYHVLNGRGPRALMTEQEGVCTREQVESAAIAFSAAVGDTECALAETHESDPSDPTLPGVPAEPETGPAASDDDIEARFMMLPGPEWTPSREASLAMALIMGMCDGNAQASFVYAKRMAQVTGDTDTWVQVGHAVCLAYGFQPMRLA